MNFTLRNVALVLSAAALVGLIPDTLSVQTPRTETITLLTHGESVVPVVLPPPPLAPPEAASKDLNDYATDHTLPTPAARVPEPLRSYDSLELYIHLPPDAAKYQPLRILFVLHGMGGRGGAFSQGIVSEADKNHWLVVAPTIPYANYMDPVVLLQEDIRYASILSNMMNDLPKKLGLKLRKHALVYGFSRGAQLAHRFALLYPERTESVAAISAGSFTLPADRANNDAAQPLLKMPYGVGDFERYVGHPLNRTDLSQVSFLIEVGANDSAAKDVPRQFDPYVGVTRVDRARAFEKALLRNGIRAQLIVFPGTAHEMTGEMISTALKFLRDDELAKKLND